MKKKLIVILFSCVFLFSSFADVLYAPDWGYSLDMPEGFLIAESQDGARFQLQHSALPIELLILSYTEDRYIDARSTLEDVFSKLQAEGEIAEIEWRNNTQALGIYNVVMNNAIQSGWAVSVILPENKGTAVFLCHAPQEAFADCEQIIISILDSICIDRGSNFEAGIFTQYAFPKEGDVQIELEIAGKKIQTTIDSSDVMANNFVIQREYAILEFYAGTNLWKEAWQRYYRLIYRDSYKRLERVAFDIYSALSPGIRRANKDSFDATLVQTLLTWTQGFDYERIPLGTDFAPLPAMLLGQGSDCDSRAMLLSVLLDQMNYDTMVFFSPEYSHALFGINMEGAGARIAVDEKMYLVGETTAPVNLGQVAQDQSDPTKWIHVEGLQF